MRKQANSQGSALVIEIPSSPTLTDDPPPTGSRAVQRIASRTDVLQNRRRTARAIKKPVARYDPRQKPPAVFVLTSHARFMYEQWRGHSDTYIADLANSYRVGRRDVETLLKEVAA